MLDSKVKDKPFEVDAEIFSKDEDDQEQEDPIDSEMKSKERDDGIPTV